ncbi:hypothetical protein J2128_001114 [Methanomicrobium sp. W14]|uniref:hypothetical protein n=1 Tax=Methanomicrobium sp. W14 TaxID=2817839 RepID=UPI001AE89BF7|nr:hypothetical protein [Methanomicrobium sp. W14]MBP2133193.1 hypothetical protein [Methanomicrobium sp. W14]
MTLDKRRLYAVAAISVVVVILALLYAFVFTNDDGDLCLTTVLNIDSVENEANDRIADMDVTNPDDFTYAKAKASKEQYITALSLMNSSGRGCMSDADYRNRVRSLELKYGYLDLLLRFHDEQKNVSTLLYQSYPNFQDSLKKSLENFEGMKNEVKVLQVMYGDVDESLLSPGNQDILTVINDYLNSLLSDINVYISSLSVYR